MTLTQYFSINQFKKVNRWVERQRERERSKREKKRGGEDYKIGKSLATIIGIMVIASHCMTLMFSQGVNMFSMFSKCSTFIEQHNAISRREESVSHCFRLQFVFYLIEMYARVYFKLCRMHVASVS